MSGAFVNDYQILKTVIPKAFSSQSLFLYRLAHPLTHNPRTFFPFSFRRKTSTQANCNENFFLFLFTASYGTYGFNTGDCQDFAGRTISHSKHFVPPGPDLCRLCVCNYGLPQASRDFVLSLSPLLTRSSYCRVSRSSMFYAPVESILSSKFICF